MYLEYESQNVKYVLVFFTSEISQEIKSQFVISIDSHHINFTDPCLLVPFHTTDFLSPYF